MEDSEPLTEDDALDIADGLFEDICEQHGLDVAVSVFLSVIGQWAAQTNQIPFVSEAMNTCIGVALECSDAVTIN